MPAGRRRGHSVKLLPLVDYDSTSAGRMRWVWDTEEKGSDVNMAVELVNDAWLNLYDLAVVISNDSDLERAVYIAKRKQRAVGVLVRGDAEVNSLKRASTFWKKLRSDDLASALLPRDIPGKSICIAAEWAEKESTAGVRQTLTS